MPDALISQPAESEFVFLQFALLTSRQRNVIIQHVQNTLFYTVNEFFAAFANYSFP